MSRTILLCSFRYPPYSRVGAYRWAKLSRRLAERGHVVHVCTVRWPQMEATDWLGDVEHPNIHIHRTRSGYVQYLKYAQSKYRAVRFLRGTLLPRFEKALRLDEAQFWAPFLLHRASAIARAFSPDVLIATGPPFSSNAAATLIKRRHPRLRLIQDFRDPWEAKGPREQARLRRCLEAADAVVAVTPAMADFFASAGARRTLWISNGFDPRLLSVVRRGPGREYDFVHIGAIFNERVTPLERFLAWVRRRVEGERPVTVLLVGRFPRQLAERYADLVSRGSLVLQPQMPQTAAFERVAKARFALQLNAPVAETQVSTKIFEYAALRVPTVSINYGGAIDSLVREHDLGWSIHAELPDFDARLDACMSAPDAEFDSDVDAYSFDTLAARYSDLIESL